MDLSWIALSLFLAVPAHAACGQFKALEFTPTKVNGVEVERTHVGAFTIDAGTAPATVANGKASCTTTVAGVEGDEHDAYALGADRVLLHSIEGESHRYSLIDLKTCKAVWQSALATGGKVEARAVHVDANCGECEEEKKYDGVCSCHAAEVLTLNQTCELEFDEAASRVLTRQQLKVAFTGQKKVKGARSTSAQLLE